MNQTVHKKFILIDQMHASPNINLAGFYFTEENFAGLILLLSLGLNCSRRLTYLKE